MPLPRYSDAIKDPFFANASIEDRIALNDKYWNAYQRENPGDKWGESQAQASRKALEVTANIDSADPLSKRALEFQREQAETQIAVNNMDADGGWESPQQRERMIGQRKEELGAKRQQLDKTFSLFKPEVAKEMEPTWKALDRYASDSGYFGGEGGLKGAATLVGDVVTFGAFSEKAAEDKIKYENLRDTVSKDFNLAPEEVDDVMRHRLNKFDGEVSRDAFGSLHFKDSVLVKNTDEIEDIVANSKLPDAVKAKAKEEAPQRVALFKENVVQTAKQNFPELAKELELGDDINENYRKIVDVTNKSRTAQAASGAGAYALGRVGDAMWAKQKTTEDPFIGAVAGEFKKVAEDEVKRKEGINALSDKIQQDKVRIFGTDAATVGQGGASVLESVGLVVFTGSAGNLIKAERIARAGTVGKAILGGVKAGLTVAPTAAIYGGEQALDTYERASQSDDPAIRERAGELATKSFIGEFGITTGMSMIGLGGAEKIGAALASKATRNAFAKSVSGAVGKAAMNFGVAPVSEAFEESLITAFDAIHVQQQLNPDMTDEQVRSSIKDTIISTLVATGGVAGPKGTIDLIGDIKNLSTQDKTTEELHDLSDAEYTRRATQENLPETEAEGRAFPASGTVSVAEIERERLVQIDKATDPEERASLENSTAEELAEDWGVDLTEESIQNKQQDSQSLQSSLDTFWEKVSTEKKALSSNDAFELANTAPINVWVEDGNGGRAKIVSKKTGKTGTQTIEFDSEYFNEETGEWEPNPSAYKAVSKKADGSTYGDLPQAWKPGSYTDLEGNVVATAPRVAKESQEPGAAEAESAVAPAPEPTPNLGETRSNLGVVPEPPTAEAAVPTEPLPEGQAPPAEEAGGVASSVNIGSYDESVKRRAKEHKAENEAAGALGISLNSVEDQWKEKGVELKLSIAKNNDNLVPEGSINLDLVKVPKNERSKGIGSQVINDLKNLADRTGKEIHLLPLDTESENATGQKVAAFYEKNGFTRYDRGLKMFGMKYTPQPNVQNQPQTTAPTGETQGTGAVQNTPTQAQAEVEVDVASEETVRAVNNAVLEALGLTAEEAQGITGEDVLSQEPEQSPTPKGQVTFHGLSEAFITYMKTADGSTAVHEPIHVARRFLLNRNIPADKRLGITDEMIDAANEFVGAKDSNWTEEQEEKFARAFERYLWEGAETGNAKVDTIFSKIRDLLRKVYSAIEGSSLNVELTPEIKKLFGQLITRGETLKEQGAKPTKIPLKVSVEGKAQTKPIRKKTTRKVPAPTPFGVKREDLDKARKKYGIPEQPGMVVRMTDEEAFDEAYAMMAKHDKGEDVLVGQQLVLDLMEDNRGTNKVEVALLAIHGFEIQKALKDLENKIAKLAPGETQKRKAFETLQEALLNDFQDLVNVTQLQGSKAGLALQAMKLVANQVYSVDAMLRRAAIWKNKGNKGANKPLTPGEIKKITKQSEKIQDITKRREELEEGVEERYTLKESQAILEAAGKKMAKEKPAKPRSALAEKASVVATSARDRLRAMGLGVTRLSQVPETPKKKVAALLDRSGNFLELGSDETHAFKAQVALKEKGNSQDINKALQVALQSGFARVVVDGDNLYVDFGESKNTLTPSQRKALIAHAESVGYTSITTDNYNGSKVVWEADTLFQEEENTQVEVLDAISDVGLEYFANGAKTLEAFTEKVVAEFGEEFRSEAQTIFSLTQEKYKKLASNARQKTPQELASLIDPTQDLSQKMVYNMALGFMRQGLKGDAVLDAVTKLLRNDYPDITREEVVIAFTGYGKILIPSQEQIKKDIRELRTIERLKAQLDDLAKGDLPKRTGLQRDKTTSPVRALMKRVEQAIRDSGLKHNDRKDRLAGSLDPIRTRLKNEIADMDQAIKTKTALNKVKKEPKIDTEIEQLKKQRDDMKKRYDAAFGIDRKKMSVETQIKKASAMLDRQITRLEKQMRGEILDKSTKVKLDSPELKAKREKLESLREAKRIAEEALNPKKTSAEIATDRLRTSAQKSIERFEHFIKNGTYPPKADGTPATIDDVMQELLNTRDRLRDTVREIKKDQRILTPPEVIARNRAVRQLNKTIADLEGRIARRDFSKRAKKPESTDPEVRNLKATVASLRETLGQLEKDTLKPISPEEKRIQRMIAASKKRKENYGKRLAAGDFAKTVKRDTKEDSRLTAVKIEEAKAKAEWLEEGRKYALENMTATQRFWHRVKSAAMIRKIVTLGAEYGIAFRQLLFFTFRFWINPKVVTRTFIKAFSAGFSRDKEIEYYNEIIDRPNSVYDKRMKMPFISPFADIERMQEMDAVDPDVLEKLNAKIPKWIPLRWATEFMLSVERFNRVSTNVTRAYMADNLINKGVRDPGNPTKDELAVIGNAVLAATGRGSLGDGKLDAGLALLNTVTISARYAVSRAQMTALQPLWTTAGTWTGTGKIRARIAADIYGKALVGRVLVGHIIAGIIQAALPDEEEEDIEWNPTSGRFGGISYKGTIIELNGGARAYINLLAQGIMGHKLNSKGEIVPLRGEGAVGYGKKSWRDELYGFVRNRENINMAMIIDTIEQQHFGDIPMTKTSFTRQLLEPIIVEDLVNIFETHGIRDGAVLATAMFFGVGVRTPWEKTEKKEPELNWIRF